MDPSSRNLGSPFRRPASGHDLASIRLYSPPEVLASRLLEDGSFRDFAGPGAVDTDRRPRLEYSAAAARRKSRSPAESARPAGAARRGLIAAMAVHAAADPPSELQRPAELAAYAEGSRRLGLLRRALAASRLAVTRAPERADARLALGRALQDSGENGEAGIELKKVIQLDPRLGQAWVSLGKLAMEEGRFSEAAGVFARMKRWHSQAPDALYGEASAWLSAKRADKAEPLVKEFSRRFGHLGQASVLKKSLQQLNAK